MRAGKVPHTRGVGKSMAGEAIHNSSTSTQKSHGKEGHHGNQDFLMRLVQMHVGGVITARNTCIGGYQNKYEINCGSSMDALGTECTWESTSLRFRHACSGHRMLSALKGSGVWA